MRRGRLLLAAFALSAAVLLLLGWTHAALRDAPPRRPVPLHPALFPVQHPALERLPLRDLPVYWAAAAVRPPAPPSPRFLTFEPWNGGWNNRRMSLELAVALAFLFNRTLVLPPPRPASDREIATQYEDVFDVDDLRRLVPVLTYVEYRRLKPLNTSNAACNYWTATEQSYSFCKAFSDERQELAGNRLMDWRFLTTVYAWPAVPSPPPPDLTGFAAGRDVVSAGEDAAMRTAAAVHFPQTLFNHWYTVLWVADRSERRRLCALLRDHVHVRAELLELAVRVERHLGGNFSAVHLRRTDFGRAYPDQLRGAAAVAENLRNHLLPGEPLFVASDERDDRYFRPLDEAFPRVVRLRHVMHLFKNDFLPVQWHGILEQLICARARVFVGTQLSTFSGYVVRLRGFMRRPNTESYFHHVKYPTGTPRVAEDRPYSWSYAWSHVLWGREYPEGWCARNFA